MQIHCNRDNHTIWTWYMHSYQSMYTCNDTYVLLRFIPRTSKVQVQNHQNKQTTKSTSKLHQGVNFQLTASLACKRHPNMIKLDSSFCCLLQCSYLYSSSDMILQCHDDGTISTWCSFAKHMIINKAQ